MKFITKEQRYDYIVNNKNKLTIKQMKELTKDKEELKELIKTFKGHVDYIRSTINFNDSYLTQQLAFKEIDNTNDIIKELEKGVDKMFNVEKITDTRYRYTCKNKNKSGESLMVEFSLINCEGEELPKLWKKHKYTDKLYKSYISVSVYVTDANGIEKEKYNPTIKLSEDKKRYLINFDWLLEISKENEQKLLNKIYNNFMEGND